MSPKLTLAMCGLCCLSIIFFTTSTYAQQKAQGDSPQRTAKEGQKDKTVKKEAKHGNFWMEQKLRFSKEILTGLANADFDALAKNAELMRGLNRIEAFIRRRKEGYRDQLKQFNMANSAIIRAAQEKNLDGATLAFNQLTISCVNCHKHLREAQKTPLRIQQKKPKKKVSQ